MKKILASKFYLLFLILVNTILLSTSLAATTDYDFDDRSPQTLQSNITNDSDSLEGYDTTSESSATTFLIRDDGGLVVPSQILKHNGFHWSLMYHLPSNPFKFKNLNGIEVNIAKNFGDSFIQFQYFKMNALFSDIIETTTLYPSNSQVFNTIESFVSIGIGYGLRTYIFQDLLSSSKSYESMTFSITYDGLNEQLLGDTFTGIGFQSGLGIYTHLSNNFYYGVKINYHFSSMRRQSINILETTSNRSIALSWLTLGINLSMYLD